MIKTRYCCLLFACNFLLTFAQEQPAADAFAPFTSPGEKGSVEIVQDPAIRNCVNVYLSYQKKLNGYKGYCISIYRGSGQKSRKNAELARANFVLLYENVRCDIKYDPPFFSVYAGDFRTYSEALKFYKEIEYNYHDIAFIRETFILFPEKTSPVR